MPDKGNWLVVVAILAWPLIALCFYRVRPPLQAAVWTILGGLLILPSRTGIKIDMVPAIDKASVSGICVLVGCFFWERRRPAPIGSALISVLVALYALGPIVTSLNNGDTLYYGDRVLPGVGWYDGISACVSQVLVFLPFVVGQRYFRNRRALRTIFSALVGAGCLFTLPVIFEVRMSPQLSNWIYGFFPSGFVSEVRYGGYRPVVFMDNGLAASFFLLTSLIAAVVWWRACATGMKRRFFCISVYLFGVLVACKSAGALCYAVTCGPIVRLTGPRMQLIVASAIVSICLLYPILRISGAVPDNVILGAASFFNQERADSLGFRFDQEKQIMERSAKRMAFGWGRYGRNRDYDENGKDISVTDGAWIITVSQFGIVGFIAQFGLLGFPVFWASGAAKIARHREHRLLLAGLALIVSLNLLEQIPNASINSWTWFLSGALLGQSQRLLAQQRSLKSKFAFSMRSTSEMRMSRRSFRTELQVELEQDTPKKPSISSV